jgi:retinol dehydrogenase-12
MLSSVPSHLISTGSGESASRSIDIGDLQSARRFGSRRAYSNAKLMVTMSTYELARRLKRTRVTATVVQPALSPQAWTGAAEAPWCLSRWESCDPFQTSPPEAARTPNLPGIVQGGQRDDG